MTLSRRLRFEILRRDNYTCRYCGASAPDAKLTVDHVIPVALGGGDEPNNLVTACAPCNAGKSSIPADAAIVEDVDATALLFAKAIERATEQRRATLTDLAEKCAAFDRIWVLWKNPSEEPMPRPDGWRSSIEQFLALSLDMDDLRWAVETTMAAYGVYNANLWRYFCGVCWNEIGRRQEMARQLIEDGEV